MTTRFFDEVDGGWTFSGECDVEKGDVTLQGAGLAAAQVGPCSDADGGTFSINVPYASFNLDLHTYGRRTVTASQTGVTAISTYVYQSHTTLTVAEVSTPAQLQAMVAADPLRFYILTDDMDLSEVSATNNWTPINDFRGTLEGNGHTISNLHISIAGQAGFFTNAYTFGAAKGGSIQNLEFTNASVTSTTNRAGVLCGTWSAFSGLRQDIYNVHVQGTVSAAADAGGIIGRIDSNFDQVFNNLKFTGSVSGGSSAGGLVGRNPAGYCYIKDSHVTGTISGTTRVGGLVGGFSGYLEDSSVTGTITGFGVQTGGAVGNFDFGGLWGVRVNASVIGVGETGGLAGFSDSYVENCRADGSVSGTTQVGGLVGRGTVNSATNHSYTQMAVTGTGAEVGPTNGVNIGVILNNYYLSTALCSGCNNALGTPLTASQMLEQASFAGFDFATIWKIPADQTPQLQWE